MRRRPKPLAVLGACLASCAALAGCGLALGIDDIPAVTGSADGGRLDALADSPSGRGDGAPREGGADGTADAAAVGQVPSRTGAPTSSTADINLVVHQLWVGDTDTTSAFNPNPGAWATFGYNIDGKVTTSVSTDVCTLAPNAASTVQIDGNDGADNSFGENIVSFLSLAFTGVSAGLTQDIEIGNRTVMLDTTGLSNDPAQTNVGLTGALYGGAQFPGTPTFTLADNWPVDPASLADGRTLASGPKVSLSDSYIVDGTWVSGHPTDLSFTLVVAGSPVALIMHQAVITFRHTVDDAGASHASGGVVSGVLKETELLASLEVAAASSGGTYCNFVGVLQGRFLAAQDIMQDGTNAPGVPCNGISVAFAFTADQIQPPSVVGAPVIVDGGGASCALDGGADAANDAGVDAGVDAVADAPPDAADASSD